MKFFIPNLPTDQDPESFYATLARNFGCSPKGPRIFRVLQIHNRQQVLFEVGCLAPNTYEKQTILAIFFHGDRGFLAVTSPQKVFASEILKTVQPIFIGNDVDSIEHFQYS